MKYVHVEVTASLDTGLDGIGIIRGESSTKTMPLMVYAAWRHDVIQEIEEAGFDIVEDIAGRIVGEKKTAEGTAGLMVDIRYL